ncbi:MAG TPA: thioredoxin family protein [Bacillales bacterium]|jgi:thiol-disulfide isomerase/thioredoxin|nr:thioredoxin family protein [Bacillales bacterium]
MDKIQSTGQFQELVENGDETIIKFEAGWCPDCKRMDMFIGDIVAEYSDKKWYEINRDEFPELAEKYEVMGIPSLLVFKNGEKTAHLHSGQAKTPDQVKSFLKTL